MAQVIGSFNPRPSPLSSGLGSRRRWSGRCSFRRSRGTIGWFWTGTVIDHNDFLGKAILVELGPVWFLSPTPNRGSRAGATLVGHSRRSCCRGGHSRRLRVGKGGRCRRGDRNGVRVREARSCGRGRSRVGGIRLIRRVVRISVTLMMRRMRCSSRRRGGHCARRYPVTRTV